MIFSCTKKVIDKIKKAKPTKEKKSEPSLFNWYLDLIKLERKTYFICTNSKTLFSFIIYVGTLKEINRIEELFENYLKKITIKEFGYSKKFIDQIELDCKQMEFLKTNNRSILGSMNDFKTNIKHRVQIEGLTTESYNSINHYLNKMPMGALKYKSPYQAHIEELNKL